MNINHHVLFQTRTSLSTIRICTLSHNILVIWLGVLTRTSCRSWLSMTACGSRLMTGLLRILRARLAYFKVFSVSSKLVSAVLLNNCDSQQTQPTMRFCVLCWWPSNHDSRECNISCSSSFHTPSMTVSTWYTQSCMYGCSHPESPVTFQKPFAIS